MADVALCTAAQVKTRANISGTGSDALIALLIPQVLRRFNMATGRELLRLAQPATRRFDATRHLVPLPGRDLRTATTVTLHPESVGEALALVAGTHYELALDDETNTAGAIRLAYGVNLWSTRALNFGRAGLEVVGEWGIWADVDAVPADINLGAVAMVIDGINLALAGGLSVGDLSGAGMTQFAQTWDIPAPAWRALQPYNRELGVW